MLKDSVRSVRTEAARILADAGAGALNAENAQLRDASLKEYKQGLTQHSDLAMSHMGLALLAERQQDFAAAVASYKTAIDVQPDVTGPRSNLAALYESLAGNVPAGSQRASNARAEVARLRSEELKLLERDALLVPDSGLIQYRYGLALYLAGDLEKSKLALQKACEVEPESEQFRVGLTLLLQKLEELRKTN
jgi:tetratricopeptide (TPR) repeat protein